MQTFGRQRKVCENVFISLCNHQSQWGLCTWKDDFCHEAHFSPNHNYFQHWSCYFFPWRKQWILHHWMFYKMSSISLVVWWAGNLCMSHIFRLSVLPWYNNQWTRWNSNRSIWSLLIDNQHDTTTIPPCQKAFLEVDGKEESRFYMFSIAMPKQMLTNQSLCHSANTIALHVITTQASVFKIPT